MSRGRKLVLTGGVAFGLFLAIVAVAGLSSSAPSFGNAESAGSLLALALEKNEEMDESVAVVDLDHGDHCHLVPISCGGISGVSSVGVAVPAEVTVSDSSALVRIDIPPLTSISDVLLSNTTPPPRSA